MSLIWIKNAASPTTGLCTSQKALSWLSRIFRSILSRFLSTLREKQKNSTVLAEVIPIQVGVELDSCWLVVCEV